MCYSMKKTSMLIDKLYFIVFKTDLRYEHLIYFICLFMYCLFGNLQY